MITDHEGKMVSVLQISSTLDGTMSFSMHIHPAANNMPVMDALYAVLDDLVGVRDETPEGGGDEPAQPPSIPPTVGSDELVDWVPLDGEVQ
jgi:hypothetical protein